MSPGDNEITRLLQEWSDGDRGALDQLSQRIYPELKKLARIHFQRESPGGTLQPTALVNEAYLRMVGSETHGWKSRLQFFKFANTIMSRVLMDYFRSKRALKHGAGQPMVSLDEARGRAGPPDVDLMRLEEAIRTLKRVNPLQGEIVELRFFGGLTIDEVARALNLSRSKVKREWTAASAWLYDEAGPGA